MGIKEMDNFMVAFREAHPQLAEELEQIQGLAKKMLWHDITVALESLVANNYWWSQQGLVGLYKNFISFIHGNMSHVAAARLAVRAAVELTDHKQAIEFVNFVHDSLRDASGSEQSLVMLLSTACRYQLLAGQLSEGRSQLEAIDVRYAQLHSPSPAVSCEYYRCHALVHKKMDHSREFYEATMHYLLYTNLATMSYPEQQELAVDAGLASLIGRNCYSFGDLLQHPIMQSLTSSPQAWLPELMRAVNRGQVEGMKALWKKHEQGIGRIPQLKDSYANLLMKVSTIALLELALDRRVQGPYLSFTDIQEATKCALEEVDCLIMRALSLQLIKGKIDDIKQQFYVSWIAPRALDADVVNRMKEQVDVWTKNVHDTLIYVENQMESQ